MARGRDADTPREIPKAGWKDIALRVKDKVGENRVSLIAAGVAFYALLAIFPAITAMMAIAGLVMDPSQVTNQLQAVTQMMPQQAAQIILDQAVAVTGSEQTGLGLAFIGGLLIAIYSASKGMTSLMQGLNVAYDEAETRGFFRRTLVTLTLTVALIAGLILGLLAALAVPAVLAFLPLPNWLETVLSLSRWALLAIMTITGLGILYRYGPARDDAEWKWLSAGAVMACIVWLVASIGFSIYVSNFGSYNESFGSMAGVIVLLMWLWISAFIILLGAELNAEMEAQTRADTTTGPEEPMGTRGAEKADRLGEATASG